MPHHLNLPDLLLCLASLLILAALTVWSCTRNGWRTWPKRLAVVTAAVLFSGLAVLSYLLSFNRFYRLLPNVWATWVEACGLFEAAILCSLVVAILAWREAPSYSPERRTLLRAGGTALAAAPLAATAFGIITRNAFSLNEVQIRIPRLPRDLQGLKLVQITDIHLSPFLSERQFARVIDMANEAKAHVALITGDLITRFGDPLDACLRQLGRLRAEAPPLGCLGNHEIYTQTEAYVQEQGRRIGIEFLRHRARTFHFGKAALNFAGVDYQSFGAPYLTGAEDLVLPGQVNVLLSHNPDVFPVAVRKGFDLTIAGHTHGGQVNVEILNQNVNFARTFTPFVRGLYRQGDAAVYVSSGVGTIGVPVRIGAPPEVTLIQLCAS